MFRIAFSHAGFVFFCVSSHPFPAGAVCITIGKYNVDFIIRYLDIPPQSESLFEELNKQDQRKLLPGSCHLNHLTHRLKRYNLGPLYTITNSTTGIYGLAGFM